MSKSLKRVMAEADKLGLDIEVIKLEAGTTTAQMAADAVGCIVDQIIKSIVFRVDNSNEHVLFLTAGNNRVDTDKAADLSNAILVKADAASIRKSTGFAIGGVSPLGHLNPIKTFVDPHIMEFDIIWAAAGTPHHIFALPPKNLVSAIAAKVADFTV